MQIYLLRYSAGFVYQEDGKAARVFPSGLGILQPVLQHGVAHDVDPAFHAHFIHRV